MMKQYLSILLILFIVQCGFAQENSFNEVFEISDMKFEYNLFYSGSVPRTKGKLYIDIGLKKPVKSVGLVNTKAHYVLDGDVFFSTKTMNDIISESTTNYLLESATELDWGVYFKVFVILKNEDEESQYVYSDLYCTTDLLLEEDRTHVLDYVSSAEVAECVDAVDVVGGNVEFVGDNCGEYLIYDLNGSCVARGTFAPNDVLLLPENCPCMCIIQVIYENNKVVTKKIFR